MSGTRTSKVFAKPPKLEEQIFDGDCSTTGEDCSSATPLTIQSPGSVDSHREAVGECHLLSCPWHEGLAFFLSSSELGKLCYVCTALRNELTIPSCRAEDPLLTQAEDGGSPPRLLVVPALELRLENCEAELRRVSLEHIRILRVQQRMSFNAVYEAMKLYKSELRSLNRFVCKGCPMHSADVQGLLIPLLRATDCIKLLNLEKNQLGDAFLQELCNSGILEKVETLNLRFNQIGDDGAKAIANCTSAKNMKWINLKMNRVKDAGAIALAQMLSDSQCQVTLLNLRRQSPGLTDRAAVAFADMLRTNACLGQLRLRRNQIRDTGAAALANAVSARLQRLCKDGPSWQKVYFELDLEDNKVGDLGAVALLRGASQTPSNAKLEILLSGNFATKDSLCLAVVAAGEHLDVSDPRLTFESKPEAEV
jgi:hypothetical protein